MTNSELYDLFRIEKYYDAFTEDQKVFYERFFEGHNIFLTGSAGTGKSYCINRLFEFCEKRSMRLTKTATTGTAAINIGGSTIHSWSRINIGDERIEYIIKSLQENRKKTQRIINCKRLLIDEISMFSGRLFTMLDIVLRSARKIDRPFGGLQLIIIGDPLQLPTIDKNAKGENDFFFLSPSYVGANFKNVVLTTVVRQEDKVFSNLLDQLRVGDTSRLDILRERLNAVCKETIQPLKVKPLKTQVDKINDSNLNALRGKTYTYNSVEFGAPHNLSYFEKYCSAKKVINLKIQTQVILTSNIDIDEGLVNGSMGIVTGFEPTENGSPDVLYPRVQFKDCSRVITPYEYNIREEDKNGDYQVIAQRAQIPLKLGWANTIHSVQGSTVDSIEVGLDNLFIGEQAYVGLSRCKTIDGLYIVCKPQNFNEKLFKPNKIALDFYNNIIQNND